MVALFTFCLVFVLCWSAVKLSETISSPEFKHAVTDPYFLSHSCKKDIDEENKQIKKTINNKIEYQNISKLFFHTWKLWEI